MNVVRTIKEVLKFWLIMGQPKNWPTPYWYPMKVSPEILTSLIEEIDRMKGQKYVRWPMVAREDRKQEIALCLILRLHTWDGVRSLKTYANVITENWLKNLMRDLRKRDGELANPRFEPTATNQVAYSFFVAEVASFITDDRVRADFIVMATYDHHQLSWYRKDKVKKAVANIMEKHYGRTDL